MAKRILSAAEQAEKDERRRKNDEGRRKAEERRQRSEERRRRAAIKAIKMRFFGGEEIVPIPQGDHILVVEDIPAMANLIADHLWEAGYKVEIAHSVEAAWRATGKKLPVLVITDDILPDVDGWEFMRSVRQFEQTEAIPIILLGGKEPDWSLGYMHLPFDFMCTKPFNPAELITSVKRFSTRTEEDGRIRI